MDIKQMTYILTIAREGGITKAAAKLYLTQSALDQQLLKLEHELGTQLFCRARGSFAMTPAGEVYVKYAEQMVSLRNEAYRIIRDMADQRRGSLQVAFAPERGMEMFVHVYPRFYRDYPEITVVPSEMGVRRQLELLQRGELDLGFVSGGDSRQPGVEYTTLMREEFLLVTPLDHPLAALAAPPGRPLTVLDGSQLEELTFSLIYRQSTQREVIDPLFQRHGIQPNLFLETASNRANLSMVEEGLSCSIVPEHYTRGARKLARFRLSDKPEWTISACRRRGRYVSKAAQYFQKLAAEYFQDQRCDLGGETDEQDL